MLEEIDVETTRSVFVLEIHIRLAVGLRNFWQAVNAEVGDGWVGPCILVGPA